MLNHKFTGREAAFILILVAAILGYFYYYVVYQNIEKEIAKYDTADVMDEIDAAQMKYSRLVKMEKELDEEGESTSILGVYNNQSAELLAIAEILEGKATGISMNWDDPQLNGTIVRRDVTITFTSGSIEEAGELVKQISDCEYTLLIVDMTMMEDEVETEVTVENIAVPALTEAADEEDVVLGEDADEAVTSTSQTTTETYTVTKKVTTVTITIRFFETTNGATNLNGLVVPTPAPSVDDDDSSLPSTAELNADING